MDRPVIVRQCLPAPHPFLFLCARYRGLFHAVQVTFQEGGLRALFRGIGPTVIGIVPYAGTRYGS